jgi:hypothetical protein
MLQQLVTASVLASTTLLLMQCYETDCSEPITAATAAVLLHLLQSVVEHHQAQRYSIKQVNDRQSELLFI